MTGFTASLTEGVIHLDTQIGEDSARLVMESLLYFDVHHPGRPITLVVDSPGGQVYAGLGIYDVMRQVRSPLYTIGVNEVAGLAVLLVAAGDPGRRFLMPHCRVVAGGVTSPVAVTQAIVSREVKRLSAVIADCLAECTSNLYIEHFLPPGRYLEREQAIGLGLVDGVLELDPPEYFGYKGGAAQQGL